MSEPRNIPEFKRLHNQSGPAVLDRDMGRFLWPNTAMLSDTQPWAQMWAPVEEGSTEYLAIRRRYLALKLQADTEFFQERRSILAGDAAAGGISLQQEAELRRMAANIRRMRVELQEVDRQLSETPAGIAKRQRAEHEAERQRHNQARYGEIMAISIDGHDPDDGEVYQHDLRQPFPG